ncbi:hypothetical protein [Leucobacter ruminantium]|uniref:Uncharacterized protein n=1 Tax=Leucobacter ruminantium TaxID=1289170 RepID=A0A939RXV1_9MICO|nr:hypothetical protein [Leucobacter ruminantium]MBO1806557.1 hypothetical protein [Leucobacter ruminantium]
MPLLGPWNSLRGAVDFVAAVAPRRVFPIHDVHLSTTGYALFWNLITKSADAAGIESLEVVQGEPFFPIGSGG